MLGQVLGSFIANMSETEFWQTLETIDGAGFDIVRGPEWGGGAEGLTMD